MSDDEIGERGPSAAEASKEGLASISRINPNSRANLIKGHEANRARGQVPHDPDYVSRRKQFLDGTLKVEELDDEELDKMQFKDRHGRFSGRPFRPTAAHMRVIHAEWRKRIARKAEENVANAIDVIAAVMNARGSKEADRLRAAELILNRALGRETQVQVNVSGTWEDFEDNTIVEINRDAV